MKTMMKKPAVKKPAMKKFAMGGMMGELPTVSAAQQQANAAEVARQDALQQQYMQQQRQKQQMAASDPRARATAGRGRIQTMMAKGGAVKKKAVTAKGKKK